MNSIHISVESKRDNSVLVLQKKTTNLLFLSILRMSIIAKTTINTATTPAVIPGICLFSMSFSSNKKQNAIYIVTKCKYIYSSIFQFIL